MSRSAVVWRRTLGIEPKEKKREEEGAQIVKLKEGGFELQIRRGRQRMGFRLFEIRAQAHQAL